MSLFAIRSMSREGSQPKWNSVSVGMDFLGCTPEVLVVGDAGGGVPERRVDWCDISAYD